MNSVSYQTVSVNKATASKEWVIVDAGDLTLQFGDFKLGGIGTATFGAIILNALLNRTREQ